MICKVQGCSEQEEDMWVAPVRQPDGFTLTVCRAHRGEVERTLEDLTFLVERGEQPILGVTIKKGFLQ